MDRTCSRCKKGSTATTLFRGNELCPACFRAAIRSKALKHMEEFRTRHNRSKSVRPRILMPMTFRKNESVVLDILQEHRLNQIKKAGLPGFDLYVIAELRIMSQMPNEIIQKIKNWVLSNKESENADNIHFLMSDETRLEEVEMQINDCEYPGTMCRSISSDARQFELHRKYQAIAEKFSCSAIVYCDSIDDMAAEILLETAKGNIAKADRFQGTGDYQEEIKIIRPLEDLSNLEIESYIPLASTMNRKLEETTQQVERARNGSTGNRDAIAALLKDYTVKLEQTYPAAVTNVVRAVQKLDMYRKN